MATGAKHAGGFAFSTVRHDRPYGLTRSQHAMQRHRAHGVGAATGHLRGSATPHSDPVDTKTID
jgi:hypothetical protein